MQDLWFFLPFWRAMFTVVLSSGVARIPELWVRNHLSNDQIKYFGLKRIIKFISSNHRYPIRGTDPRSANQIVRTRTGCVRAPVRLGSRASSVKVANWFFNPSYEICWWVELRWLLYFFHLFSLLYRLSIFSFSKVIFFDLKYKYQEFGLAFVWCLFIVGQLYTVHLFSLFLFIIYFTLELD